jgi:hypothetical protein
MISSAHSDLSLEWALGLPSSVDDRAGFASRSAHMEMGHWAGPNHLLAVWRGLSRNAAKDRKACHGSDETQ